MSLTSMYQELKSQAERTGQDRAYTLKGGARIAVRVQGGVTTLTISRQKKRVGDTELTVFQRDLGIPAYASRYPAEGQATRTDADGFLWFFVAYRFSDQEGSDAT